MKTFCLWFIDQLPDFLMSEPICYLVGFAFGFVTLALLGRMLRLGR